MTTDTFNEDDEFNETETSALLNQLERYLHSEFGYNHNLEVKWIHRCLIFISVSSGWETVPGYSGEFSYDTKDNKEGKGGIDFTCHRPNGKVIENLDIHSCGGFNK